MRCHLNFICPLYPACEYGYKVEMCSIYKDVVNPKPKEFKPYPTGLKNLSDSPPDELIIFDPFDLNEPTP